MNRYFCIACEIFARPLYLAAAYSPLDEKRIIGEDVKTVQFGWPLGMPIVRKLEPGLWEVRSTLADKIARAIFTVKDQQMVLLHGFIKKSDKTPQDDLNVAHQRLAQLRGEK